MSAGDAKPTDRIERALHASLRPVDPGANFTAMVQARLATAVPPRPRWRYSASLALAASIVVASAVGWQLQDLHLQQAHAQTQLLLALEITSERLGQVQRRIEQYQSRENSL
jgi:hypothetical protein